MKIYFITDNDSKFREASLILKPAGIKLVQKKLKLDETKTTDQKKVVIEKAVQAFKKIKKPLITDDTAIFFESYPSFPGTFTKFVFNSLGFEGIEKLLKGNKRKAFFQTMICYTDGKTFKVFSGKWKGRITNKISEKFNPDWQYNSIFIPQGYSVPLAEISDGERAKKSHRRKALISFMKCFRRLR